MKIPVISVGLLLIVVSLYHLSQYALDYSGLADYGKGLVWGNIILFLIGSGLLWTGLKIKPRH